MNARLVPSALALLLALPLTALAGSDGPSLEDQVREFRLDNGLTLLVLENHDSPTIGAVTAFAVGTAEEKPGAIGVTHILEHMLFKGTHEIGTTDWEAEKSHHDRIEELTQEILRLKAHRPVDQARVDELLGERAVERAAAKEYAVDNELMAKYQEAGGTQLNAFTGTDVTAYVQATPSNRLELWMYLESERLRGPVLRQFYTEVENVQEERRLSVEGSPFRKLYEAFCAVAFDEHGYGFSGIGYPSDIQGITRTETEEWFRVYYAPNRMTLVLVGDVDPEGAYELTKEYFGDIPAQEPPTPLETFDIEKKGMRRVEVEYDAEPQILMGFPKHCVPHPDDAALHVVSNILAGGKSSRMERNLVNERQIASSIDIDHETPGNRWDNLIMIQGLPRAPHTAAELEAAIWDELEALKRDGVTERELAKAKNGIKASRVRDFTSNLSLAIDMAVFNATHGDWRTMLEADRAVEAVTREDVQRVARATFRRNRSVVATLVEPEFEADPAKVEAGHKALARMVDALGGAKEVAAVTSVKVTSDVAIQTPGGALAANSETYLLAPGSSYQTFSIFGQTQVQVVAKAGAWSISPGGNQEMEGDELADARAGVERDMLVLAYPSLGEEYVLQGEAAADGLIRVEARGPVTGKPFDLLLHEDTGLPAKIAYAGKHPMTGADAAFEESFEDFRAVDGVMRAHRIVTRIDGDVFAEATVTAIVSNPEIPADAFVRPSS
ncbi:insulinase family protein [bacterium]|nr:insulinase family protein [bacterium]